MKVSTLLLGTGAFSAFLAGCDRQEKQKPVEDRKVAIEARAASPQVDEARPSAVSPQSNVDSGTRIRFDEARPSAESPHSNANSGISLRDSLRSTGDPFAVFWMAREPVLHVRITAVRGSPGTNGAPPIATATVIEALRGKSETGTIELSFSGEYPERPDTVGEGSRSPWEAHQERVSRWKLGSALAPAVGADLIVVLDGTSTPWHVRPDGIFPASRVDFAREGILGPAKRGEEADDALKRERDADAAWTTVHAHAAVEKLARRAEFIAVARPRREVKESMWMFEASDILHGKQLVNDGSPHYVFDLSVDAETEKLFAGHRYAAQIDLLVFLTNGTAAAGEPVYRLVSPDAIMAADPALVARARKALK